MHTQPALTPRQVELVLGKLWGNTVHLAMERVAGNGHRWIATDHRGHLVNLERPRPVSADFLILESQALCERIADGCEYCDHCMAAATPECLACLVGELERTEEQLAHYAGVK